MTLILERFNLWGFRIINDLAGHNVWLDRFMIFVADKMGYLMILGVLILVWKSSNRLKTLILTIGSAILARAVFVELIRYLFYNPRPYMALDNINILINHEVSSSFPSGHATFYFAMAMGVYLFNKKFGWIYFALAGLMGFARIFVSVHWPLDILAGALLGVATTFGINYLKQKMPLRAFWDK